MKAKLLLGFISAGVLFTAVNAQKKEIPYKDADAVISASRRLLLDTPSRQTYTEEKFASSGTEAKPTKVVVTEEIPSKGNRTVTTTWSDVGKKETKEFVYVDGTSYWRKNDGRWTTAKVSGLTELIGGPGPMVVGHKKEAWLVEEVTENGRKIKVYETRDSYTHRENNSRVVYVATVRYWIRDDGLTIKKQSENTVVGKPQITKGVWNFEYENIEIKAPSI